MVTVNEVFAAAMALMDELAPSGEATMEATAEYAQRTMGILNGLTAEFSMLCGGKVLPVETLDDDLVGVPDGFCRSALPYGLAANLLADENPALAGFCEQRYEELRDRFARRTEAASGEIADVYGGLEHGQFGHW